MPLRSATSPGASRKIAFATVVLTAACALPAFSQQAPPITGTQTSPALPPQISEKLDRLQADLKAAQIAHDAKAEAATLNSIGDLYFRVSEFSQALDTFTQALDRARRAHDEPQQAAAMNGAAYCRISLSEYDKGTQTAQQALDLATSSNDVHGQAGALGGLGWAQHSLGQSAKALEYYARALPLAQQSSDEDLQAKILLLTGLENVALGNGHDALDQFTQALALFQKVGDQSGQARTLIEIGTSRFFLGDMQAARYAFVQAMPMFDQTGDRMGKATALMMIGGALSNAGDPKKALVYIDQSIQIFHDVGSLDGELSADGAAAAIYSNLGEPEKALELYQQALPLVRQAGSRVDEAGALSAMGNFYFSLGQNDKALESYEKSLEIFHALGVHTQDSNLLLSIGEIYQIQGETQKALDNYIQTLTLSRSVGAYINEATELVLIGSIYFRRGETDKALEYTSQSLPLFRKMDNREGEATSLLFLGAIYVASNQPAKGLDLMNQALPIAVAIGDPSAEAAVYYLLMVAVNRDQPTLAIYYGKQSVNLLQQVRSNMSGMDKSLQHSFLGSKEDYYHFLANLLIDQGRLPEAQQVLDMLKEQEFSDYVRGDTANALSPLALTPAEQQAEEDYQKSTAQIVGLGEQLAALQKIARRTPEQEKQFQQLSDQLDAASTGLNDFYARLFKLFSNSGDANNRLEDVKDREIPQLQAVVADTPHTVALYTLVSGDRYNVIVITGSTAAARKYMIAEKDLNQKVAAFEQALRDPHSDPKPLAQDLYNILIGPVKADLDQAQAQTLVWSLDGILRYVPIAALYDGKQYVVEKYATVTVTPASDAYLADKPDFTNLSAVAMGISRQYESELPALPAVAGELADVINDSQDKNARGVLPGAILLNGAFTESAMEEALDTPHTVVHIASHFVFRPGDDTQSYLLLAGKDQDTQGYHLTVADFRDKRRIALKGTDLLTLSACETGMSGNTSNGREVDGLGMTAQTKGAKAVISSLWEVDDASTGALMADFYKRWAGAAGKVPKVEALRQAQLDLLQGKVAPQASAAGRGFTVEENKPSTSTPPVGYAHPFYWAPFVLMGNWK
jgi:CHAT domain-containing protein/Tfp pilus assembly protein PilF